MSSIFNVYFNSHRLLLVYLKYYS